MQEHQAAVVQERLAGRRQGHTTIAPVQQLGVHPVFDVLDPETGRGRGHVRALGATCHAVHARDIDEQPDVYEIEFHDGSLRD